MEEEILDNEEPECGRCFLPLDECDCDIEDDAI